MEEESNKREETRGSKAESSDLDRAIEDITNVIHETSGLFHKLKKVKFDYLVQTCELYSRIDFPSIMMEACRKQVSDLVPDDKSIEKMDY